MCYKAIETVGRSTLMIKDNKVLCKVSVSGICGYRVSVQFSKEDYDKLVKPVYPVDDSNFTYPINKLFFLHFHSIDGMYLESNVEYSLVEGVDTFFEDVRVVDEFNHIFGISPESFKDCEGFRTAFNDMD